MGIFCDFVKKILYSQKISLSVLILIQSFYKIWIWWSFFFLTWKKLELWQKFRAHKFQINFYVFGKKLKKMWNFQISFITAFFCRYIEFDLSLFEKNTYEWNFYHPWVFSCQKRLNQIQIFWKLWVKMTYWQAYILIEQQLFLTKWQKIETEREFLVSISGVVQA